MGSHGAGTCAGQDIRQDNPFDKPLAEVTLEAERARCHTCIHMCRKVKESQITESLPALGRLNELLLQQTRLAGISPCAAALTAALNRHEHTNMHDSQMQS